MIISGSIPVLILGDLDPGELGRDRLARLGCGVTSLPAGADPDEIRSEALGARFVLFNNFDINGYLKYLSGSELVVLAATGYSFIDRAEARRAGARMANLADYAVPSVVEYLIWAAVEGLRRFGWLPRGAPADPLDRAWLESRELAGSNVGVIGYGHVGRRLSAVLSTLGATVRVTSRTQPDDAPNWVELGDLLAESDVVFVCCSLTDSSRRLLDAASLAQAARCHSRVNRPERRLRPQRSGGVAPDEAAGSRGPRSGPAAEGPPAARVSQRAGNTPPRVPDRGNPPPQGRGGD